MLTGIGDSNLEFNGHGWAGGFTFTNLYSKSLVYAPGGSSRDVLNKLKAVSKEEIVKGVGEDKVILVTLGINDMIQGIWPCEFIKNHLEIKKVVEASAGPCHWVWMPSHYTGHWKLELLRLFLKCSSKWNKIKFVDLTKYKKITVYNSPIDPWHLQKISYEYISGLVAQELKEVL